MPKNITDIKCARQAKRQKIGWTIEEIKKNAAKELEEFKKLAGNEPDYLVSGDMDKIIHGDNDDNEKN
jgi:hypothetical protein